MTHTDPAAAGATLSNWRSAPHNRWAFRHVDRLLPTATIPNGGAAAPAWPEAPRAFEAFRVGLEGGTPLDLDAFLRQTHTDGLLVLHDGRVAFEWLAEGMQGGTRHILMSASKSVIGLLCGALVGCGVLDPESTVAHWLPELGGCAYADATLRQLLDMRADPRLDPGALARYAAATNWDAPAPGAEPGGLHAFFRSLPAARGAHGGPFRYLSPNTDLLGWIVETAARRPLAQLLGECLWQPLGADQPAQITLDRAGAPRATGGLCATLRDFARLGQLMVDGGVHRGQPIVPGAWIADIGTGGDRAAWEQGEFAAAFGGLRMHYRSGWYVLDDAPQTLFAMGIHGQHLFVDRANRLVIAKLSSQPQALDPVAAGLTLRAVGEIRRRLGD